MKPRAESRKATLQQPLRCTEITAVSRPSTGYSIGAIGRNDRRRQTSRLIVVAAGGLDPVAAERGLDLFGVLSRCGELASRYDVLVEAE